jgi:molecular chaperone DnaK
MAIESAVNDVKTALESTDAKAIDRTLDALMQAQQKAAEALYKNTGGDAGAGPGAGAGAGPGGSGQADDVIDAEIVDDKK